MDKILNFPHLSYAEQQAVLDGPAMMPPPGVTPNLKNPPNQNHAAVSMAIVSILFVCILVPIRAYSRFIVMRRARIEDYLGLAAFAAYIGMIWAFFAQLHYGGYFVHQYDISFRNFQMAVYIAVILPFIYSITMVFAKSAILCEWMHIFVPAGTRNLFFWLCSISLTLNILLYSAGSIAEGLGCIPLDKTWKPWRPGKCIDKKVLDVTTAYFNLALDLVILALPQMVIWQLQMTRSRKIGVSIIFSVGFLTIACAAGRVWSNTMLAYVDQRGDTNYGLASLYLWGFAETTCVLVVFTVPALPKAFSDSWIGSRITKTFRSWTSQASSYKGFDSPEHSGGSKARAYQDMDQNSQTMLTVMDPAKTNTKAGGGFALSPRQEMGGIFRHTKIETTQDSISRSSSDAVFSSQHPWTRPE